MKLSEEQFERLSAYNKLLESYAKGKVKRNATKKQKEALKYIYKDLKGTLPCGSCSGSLYIKQLAKLYNDTKAEMELNKESNNESKNVIVNKTKKNEKTK